jgi:hypothetical protein
MLKAPLAIRKNTLASGYVGKPSAFFISIVYGTYPAHGPLPPHLLSERKRGEQDHGDHDLPET